MAACSAGEELLQRGRENVRVDVVLLARERAALAPRNSLGQGVGRRAPQPAARPAAEPDRRDPYRRGWSGRKRSVGTAGWVGRGRGGQGQAGGLAVPRVALFNSVG